MKTSFINSKSSLELQIHEEEVRYNEAIRMKAGIDALESIRLKIIELKSQLDASISLEVSYPTLTTLYQIVKAEKEPATYLCTPHEIILRQAEDGATIQKHLEMLAKEKLVTIKQLDKLVFSITPEGIAKAESLQNRFSNKNFSFAPDYKNLSQRQSLFE